MASYIYSIYKECDTLYELRDVCMTMKEREFMRERESVKESESKRAREREKRSEGECASATFILCCARKNVNYSKVRPAITYHLLFQIITVCSKCNIKKKGNYRYHEIKYSVRKHEDVSLFRTFLVLRKGERHLESYLFCGSDFVTALSLLCKKNSICYDEKASKSR